MRAERLTVGYTIFGSCRMHGVNPLAWATDVLGKLQAGWPRSRLDELLPDAWAKCSPEDDATPDSSGLLRQPPSAPAPRRPKALA